MEACAERGGEDRSPKPPRQQVRSCIVAAIANERQRLRFCRLEVARRGGFMAAAQLAGGAPTPEAGGEIDDSTTSLIVNSVRLEEAFRMTPGIKMYEGGKTGEDEVVASRIYLDPLDWWRVRSAGLPALGHPRPPCTRHSCHSSGVGAPLLLRWQHRDQESQQVGSLHCRAASSLASFVEDCRGVGSVECDRDERYQQGFSLALSVARWRGVDLCLYRMLYVAGAQDTLVRISITVAVGQVANVRFYGESI